MKRWSVTVLMALVGLGLPASAQTPSPPHDATGDHTITPDRVGALKLGEATEEAYFADGPNYGSYWDEGHYADTGLRLMHFSAHDLIVFSTPKDRVYRVLVGPSYRTEAGVGLGSDWRDLRRAYRSLVVTEQALKPHWVYRPDRIQAGEHGWAILDADHQDGHQPLQCAVSAPRLPNVTFFFSACGANKPVGVVEAVMVTSPDDSDLQWVDPFFTPGEVAPCPVPRTDDPEALTQRGLEAIARDRMGEYYSVDSLREGLPMLRDAALSGSFEASLRYSGVLNSHINNEVIGDPLQRTNEQGAQEVLLLNILAYLRADVAPANRCDAALLDFDAPMTDSILGSGDDIADDIVDDQAHCEADYRLGWLSMEDIESVRAQAQAWAQCWEKVELPKE